MLTRRHFLRAILATCTAPAIVRADSLMRIKPVQFGPAFEQSLAVPVSEWINIGYNATDDVLWMNGQVLPKSSYIITHFEDDDGFYCIELPPFPEGKGMNVKVSSDKPVGNYSFSSWASMPSVIYPKII